MLDKLPKVDNSPKAPCWQQKQIAAQNSYLASIREGRELVYTAPCAASPAPLETTKPREVPPRTSLLGADDTPAARRPLAPVGALTPPEPVEPVGPLTVEAG